MGKYIKKDIKHFVITVLCVAISVGVAVVVQFIKGRVLDDALTQNLQVTIHSIILLVIGIGIEILFYWGYCSFSNVFAVSCIKLLKCDYFSSIINMKFIDFAAKSESEYISQFTKSIDVIENLWFKTLPILSEILCKILFVSVGLFILDWRLALVTLVLLSTPIYVPKIIEKKLLSSHNKAIKALEKSIENFTEYMQGFETIKNFSIENRIVNFFRESITKSSTLDLANRNLKSSSRIIMMCISYFSYFIILAISGLFVVNKTFTAGEFFIAIGMIDQLSYPLISLSGLIQNMISVKDTARSIINFIEGNLNSQISISKMSSNYDNVVCFDDVSFYYDKEVPILDQFSLKIHQGSKTLLTGVSGRGKTTIVNMLLGYYAPIKGSVRIDSIEVTKVDVYGLITVVRQDPYMFSDTLRNNLTLYKDFSDEQLIEVLRKVNLHSFATAQGLEKTVESNGRNLSGGEKKRISIARALLRESSILILDEPLANLDKDNVSAIEDLLLSLTGKTLIIVSHQFSREKLSAFDNHIELI